MSTLTDENSSDALNSSFVSASEDELTETNILLSKMSQENLASAESNLVGNRAINFSGYGTDDPPSSDERTNPPDVAQDTTAFVYLLTFLCAIGGFLFGYDTGIISGAIVLVSLKFLLTSEWQEGIVSAPMAAAAIFSVLSGFLNDRFGRKPTMLVASVVFTGGAILLAVAQERYMLLGGRFILGIGIGLYLCLPFVFLFYLLLLYFTVFINIRERTIRAHTDTIRYEYSSIHNGRYRYRYEYSVRWCPSHL